MPTMRDEFNTS